MLATTVVSEQRPVVGLCQWNGVRCAIHNPVVDRLHIPANGRVAGQRTDHLVQRREGAVTRFQEAHGPDERLGRDDALVDHHAEGVEAGKRVVHLITIQAALVHELDAP